MINKFKGLRLFLTLSVAVFGLAFFVSGKTQAQVGGQTNATPKDATVQSSDPSSEAGFGGHWVKFDDQGNPVNENSDQPKEEGCFDYYKFGSVSLTEDVDKDAYAPGNDVKVSGVMTNSNAYPIIDGQIIAWVMRNNADVMNNSDHEIDEFVALDNITLKENESRNFEFNWKVPQGVLAGNYKIALFFQASHQYNLAGLYFLNNVYGALKSFTIPSSQEKGAMIDRNNLTANGQKIKLRDLVQKYAQGANVDLNVPLVNQVSLEKKVNVKSELFFWDTSRAENLVKTDQADYDLKVGQSQKVNLKYDNLSSGAYQFRMTMTDGDAKSIVNWRFAVDGFAPRVGFSGLDKFPLKKGESAKLFGCYSNSTYFPKGTGKVIITLQDFQGNQIAKKEYSGDILAQYSLIKADFTPAQDYNQAKVLFEIYDESGKLTNTVTQTYDYSQEKKASTAVSNNSGNNPSNFFKLAILILLGLLGLSVIITVVVIVNRRLKEK